MPDLDARLARLADDAAAAARPVRAAQIRRHADRQRMRAVGSAAIGLGVLAIAGGVAVAASPRPHGPTPPVPSNGASRSPRATVIPPALRMPHDGDPRWKRSDDPRIPSAFNPCGKLDVDPTQNFRMDAATATGPGRPGEESHSPAHFTDHRVLYTDNDGAEKDMDALATDLVACGWTGGYVENTGYGRETIITRRVDGPVLKEGFVTRRGNALLISYGEIGGARMSSGDYEAMVSLADELCTVLGLCGEGDWA